jgi:hypothetical protein
VLRSSMSLSAPPLSSGALFCVTARATIVVTWAASPAVWPGVGGPPPAPPDALSRSLPGRGRPAACPAMVGIVGWAGAWPTGCSPTRDVQEGCRKGSLVKGREVWGVFLKRQIGE